MDHRNKAKLILEKAEEIKASRVVEALESAAKPKEKLRSNNPGNGYHGMLYRVHKGDQKKIDNEFRKMHSHVKNLAGEAGHFKDAKKPNVMVRDYLDSKRGRHLEGYENDEKYIKKDFGQFARSYDAKLFAESADFDNGKRPTGQELMEQALFEKTVLNEGDGKLVNVHVNWTGDWGSNSHFHKQFPSMKHAKKYTSDFEKKENYRPVWTYEKTDKIREDFETDQELIEQRILLNEGDVTFHEKPDDWYKDGRTMIHVHHKGKHVATIQKMDTMSDKERHIIVSPDTKHIHHDDRFNDPLPDKYKKKTLFGKIKPGQENKRHSKRFDSRRAALRYAKNVYNGKA